MAIMGFGFKKMSVERKKSASGKININHNAKIENVDMATLSVGGKQQNAVRVQFSFTGTYDPDIASINLHGELLWVDKPEQVKVALDSWSKNKSLPQETLVPIYNAVLQRSLMQSLLLSKEMNLPPPVRLPRVSPKSEQ